MSRGMWSLSNAVIIGWVIVVLFSLGFFARSYRQGAEMTIRTEIEKAVGSGSDVAPREPQALTEVRNAETAALAREAERALDRAEALIERWQTDVVPILQNEEGRAIATATDLVRSFQKPWEGAKAPPDIAAFREQLRRLLAAAEEAARQGASSAVSVETTSRIGAEKAKAEAVTARYSAALDDIELVRTRARERKLVPGVEPLAAAMEKERLTARAAEVIPREADDTIRDLKAGSPEYRQLYERQRRATPRR